MCYSTAARKIYFHTMRLHAHVYKGGGEEVGLEDIYTRHQAEGDRSAHNNSTLEDLAVCQNSIQDTDQPSCVVGSSRTVPVVSRGAYCNDVSLIYGFGYFFR
ncbi:hypothetical protein PGTUg99_023596 [Puccinia graminis f. sp. tritici]|uniref:Uncharacterized protein n=1 Tax=Puccinia graminis f. sp. tritici TaxID=56615 RepID=A0A5B0RNH3_PUCGR|nr:hypothetical protein PGTUg99_023596 [Puccinia graminis f. sp. tritici]